MHRELPRFPREKRLLRKTARLPKKPRKGTLRRWKSPRGAWIRCRRKPRGKSAKNRGDCARSVREPRYTRRSAGKARVSRSCRRSSFYWRTVFPKWGVFRRCDHVPRGRPRFSESAAEPSDAGANQIRASVPHDAVPRAAAAAAASVRVPGD